MAQEQTSAVSQQLTDMGQQSINAMMDVQKRFLDAFQALNQQWVSSVSAEIALGSELFTKLAAAKSIPDASVACQGCANRQMEILAENARQLMAAGEKMMPRLFGNGFSGAGT
jgi:hypothetical protein